MTDSKCHMTVFVPLSVYVTYFSLYFVISRIVSTFAHVSVLRALAYLVFCVFTVWHMRPVSPFLPLCRVLHTVARHFRPSLLQYLIFVC